MRKISFSILLLILIIASNLSSIAYADETINLSKRPDYISLQRYLI